MTKATQTKNHKITKTEKKNLIKYIKIKLMNFCKFKENFDKIELKRDKKIFNLKTKTKFFKQQKKSEW